MTTIYTSDGVTITKRYRTAPAKHWVQDTADAGHYEPADVANGYYPLVNVPQPSVDHIRSTPPALRVDDTFIEQWEFSQAAQDARVAGVADEAERQQARDMIATFDQYLAGDTPSNAQVLAQIDRLTRAMKRVIRDQFGGN